MKLDGRLVLRTYTYIVLAATYTPLILIALQSVSESPLIGAIEGFTVKWYLQIPSDLRAREAFLNSVSVAVLSAGISVSIALIAAMAYRRVRTVTLVDLLIYPPLILPDIVEAIALLIIANGS